MKKTFLFLILLTFPGFLLAQEEKLIGETVLSCGATQIGDKTYSSLSINQDVSFGKLGVGLACQLKWNEDGIRDEDWKKPEDYLPNIIRYIRWANKGDRPLYIKLGELSDMRIGHGFIVNGYANMIGEKGTNGFKQVIGVVFDVNLEKGGIETLVNNVIKIKEEDIPPFRLYGGRIYVSPLKTTGVTFPPIVDRIRVGASYVRDTDPDPDNEGEEDLIVQGLDSELPLIPRLLILYYDWATIRDHGSGSGVGIMGEFPYHYFDLGYKIEYRDIKKDFTPSIFNSLYEVSRPVRLGVKDIKGWYGEVGLKVPMIFIFSIGYEDYDKRDEEYPILFGRLEIEGQLIKILTKKDISGSAIYYKKNADRDPFNFTTPDSCVIGRLCYGVTEGVNMVYIWKETYKEDGTPVRNNSITMEVHF
ncbi:MAG: hypothetical protein QME40_03390 [bacterium]|nr:hypothetical protein [bacterium]